MDKIYLTESELQSVVEESVKRVLNEGFGKQLLKGIGYTMAGGPGLAALKVYKDLANGRSASSIMGLNDKQGISNKNNASTTTEPKKTIYGEKLTYNKSNYPEYCRNFKYVNVLDGHLVGKKDNEKNSDIYNIVQNYKLSEEQRANKLKEYLEKRDKKCGFTPVQKQKVDEGLIGTIKNGIRAARIGRQLKNTTSSLMNRNAKLDMIEKEVLPLVLTNLCAAMSIEKEDPMFSLINSPSTKKKIIKMIEKEM